MLEREATHEDLEDFRRIGLVAGLVIFGAWLLRSWLAKRWPSLLVGGTMVFRVSLWGRFEGWWW